jgi:hypothetical protein
MTQLGDEELWAQACIQQALPGFPVEQHDDGSKPAMYDLKIISPNGSIGAVEVPVAKQQAEYVVTRPRQRPQRSEGSSRSRSSSYGQVKQEPPGREASVA